MSSYIFNKARQKFLTGTLAWDNASSAVIKVMFIDAANYDNSAADAAGHEFYDDISGQANCILTDGTNPVSQSILDNGTATPSTFYVTDGIAGVTGSNVTEVDGIASGQTVDAIIIFKDTTGAAGTDPLICHIDDGSGFTAGTTNGQPIDIVWAGQTTGNGDNIFKL